MAFGSVFVLMCFGLETMLVRLLEKLRLKLSNKRTYIQAYIYVFICNSIWVFLEHFTFKKKTIIKRKKYKIRCVCCLCYVCTSSRNGSDMYVNAYTYVLTYIHICMKINMNVWVCNYSVFVFLIIFQRNEVRCRGRA